MPKIHAHFKNLLDANKAVKDLKTMGYKDAHLDAADTFYNEFSSEINFAGTQSGPSLSALILKSRGHISHLDKGPLLASDPMVSGIGTFVGIDEPANVKLVVNISEDKINEMKNILIERGGIL